MDSKTIIKVDKVSKKFCKNLRYILKYGFIDISKTILGFKLGTDKIRDYEFWALKDLSFEVKKGEALGIVGPNGSGKSTLLKLLNGIFLPDKGSLSVQGRVGALIAAGAGFHPMLTGRENIYINATILGMNRSDINKNFDSIVDFAGVRDFLDTPVKNYSSGMYVRLGFSISVHCQLDVLLVDEILSVGDVNFKERYENRLINMLKKGTAIVFVSHNLDAISSLTKRCLYLKAGKVRAIGETDKIIAQYLKDEKRKEKG